MKTADDLSLLYAIQILMRDGQIELGKEEVQLKKEQVEEMFQKVQEAIQKAQEAAEKKGFFGELFDQFGAIAKIAVVVAAVASVVVTGGASLIAIAALAGTLLSSFSKELAQLAGGSDLAEKIFRYGGMGLSLAAGGAGVLQSFGVIGGSAANAAGQTALQKFAALAGKAATYTQAGATAAQAGTGYARDQYAADELGARADERQGRAERAAAMKQMEQFVEFLQEVEKSFTRAKKSLAEAIDNEAASDLTLATMGVRA
ncbi:MAG TPA: hypothetical protein VFS43_09300 [Polyangiaceae bacterium]|nr:hypothetical protein [Polyangiaceae bacterium]